MRLLVVLAVAVAVLADDALTTQVNAVLASCGDPTGRAPTATVSVSQTSIYDVTVTAQGATHVWLQDEDGAVEAYRVGTGQMTAPQVLRNELYVKALYPSCHVLSTTLTTMQQQVDNLIAADPYKELDPALVSAIGACDSNPACTEDPLEEYIPQFVTATTTSARVSVPQRPEARFGFMYVKDADGVVLYLQEFDVGAWPNNNQNYRSELFDVPFGTTSLLACAPLGQTIRCDTASLLDDLVSEKTAGMTPTNLATSMTPVAGRPEGLTAYVQSKRLFVQPYAGMCTTYMLYIEHDDTVVSYSSESSLEWAPPAGMAQVVVSLLCDAQLRSSTVVFAQATVPPPPAGADDSKVTATCIVGDKTYSDQQSWTNGAGASCKCNLGQPLCGAPPREDEEKGFTNTEAAVFTAALCIIAALIIGAIVFLYMKKKAKENTYGSTTGPEAVSVQLTAAENN